MWNNVFYFLGDIAPFFDSVLPSILNNDLDRISTVAVLLFVC